MRASKDGNGEGIQLMYVLPFFLAGIPHETKGMWYCYASSSFNNSFRGMKGDGSKVVYHDLIELFNAEYEKNYAIFRDKGTAFNESLRHIHNIQGVIRKAAIDAKRMYQSGQIARKRALLFMETAEDFCTFVDKEIIQGHIYKLEIAQGRTIVLSKTISRGVFDDRIKLSIGQIIADGG